MIKQTSGEPDFKKFTDDILKCLGNDMSIDGDDVEKIAVDNGVLKSEQIDEPCCDECQCVELGCGFPTFCLRKTYDRSSH